MTVRFPQQCWYFRGHCFQPPRSWLSLHQLWNVSFVKHWGCEYLLAPIRVSATAWAAFPTVCLADSRYDCAVPSAVLLFPRTVSAAFCVADFSPSGCTSAATLSAAPVMFSEATWVYDFCDCGVTFSETCSPSPFLLLLLVHAQRQRK